MSDRICPQSNYKSLLVTVARLFRLMYNLGTVITMARKDTVSATSSDSKSKDRAFATELSAITNRRDIDSEGFEDFTSEFDSQSSIRQDLDCEGSKLSLANSGRF